MAARKHHYVPIFYQKGFTDGEGLLWVYDRKLHAYKHLHPKVVCREEDLYSVRPENAPRDRRIETEFFSPIDSEAAVVFRRIGPEILLSDEEFTILAFFIGLQNSRLPSFARQTRAMAEALAGEWSRMRFATVERAEEALSQMEAETGERRTVSAKSMVEAIRSGQVNPVATETAFLQQIYPQAEYMGREIAKAQWTFLIAPHDSMFVLCDTPFTPVPPEGTSMPSVGFGTPGTVTFFPINQHLCLTLWPPLQGISFAKTNRSMVRAINLNIAANSERFVMGPSRDHLQFVIERSGSIDMDPNELFAVETLFSNDNDSLIRYAKRRGRYFY